MLDANYGTGDRHYSKDWPWSWTDSNVSSAQLKWLEGELAAAKGPCVVFCHEILHPDGAKGHVVTNAAAVRAILEMSGKVKTVLMGHQHSGLCEELNGTDYQVIPLRSDKIMHIGYISRRGAMISDLGRIYIEELGKCSIDVLPVPETDAP